MLISEDTVKKLQTKVDSDPVAKAVFQVMAQRERNRHNMTTREPLLQTQERGP